jgi:hypothetical protein
VSFQARYGSLESILKVCEILSKRGLSAGKAAPEMLEALRFYVQQAVDKATYSKALQDQNILVYQAGLTNEQVSDCVKLVLAVVNAPNLPEEYDFARSMRATDKWMCECHDPTTKGACTREVAFMVALKDEPNRIIGMCHPHKQFLALAGSKVFPLPAANTANDEGKPKE